MALRFMDGFDHYASADLSAKWSAVSLQSGSLSSSGGRFGGGFLTLATGFSSTYARKTLDNQATWIVGFALNYAVAPTVTSNIFRFLDAGTTQNEIQLTASGILRWTRNATLLASGSTVLSAGSWYYIEIQMTVSSSVSANSCILSINGVPEITLAAATSTKTTSRSTADTIELTAPVGTQFAVSFDDVYICDGTGSKNNSMLGDCRVEALLPTAAGTTTQWTSISGSNYANVNASSPDGDTTYVASSGITQKDTYTMGDLSTSPSSIFGIQTVLDIRKDDAGSRSIAAVIRSGGSDYDGATTPVGDTYGMATEIRELDPNGSVAWTPSAVNAMEAGVKLVG